MEDKALEKVIIETLNERFHSDSQPPEFDSVCQRLEEIRTHGIELERSKRLGENLDFILKFMIDIDEGGSLYVDEDSIESERYETYAEIRSSADIILNAMIFDEKGQPELVNSYLELYRNRYSEGKKIIGCLSEEKKIAEELEGIEKPGCGDETEAYKMMQKIKSISSRHAKIREKASKIEDKRYIERLVTQLNNSITANEKTLLSKKSDTFNVLQYNISELLLKYESTKIMPQNMGQFQEINEGFMRYYRMLDELGEHPWRDKVHNIISTVEATMSKIDSEIGNMKYKETAAFENKNRKVIRAYDFFTRKRDRYKGGKISPWLLRRLQKRQNILLSYNEKKKAKEIADFIEAKRIDMIKPEINLYKTACYFLLPVSIALGGISTYQYANDKETTEKAQVTIEDSHAKDMPTAIYSEEDPSAPKTVKDNPAAQDITDEKTYISNVNRAELTREKITKVFGSNEINVPAQGLPNATSNNLEGIADVYAAQENIPASETANVAQIKGINDKIILDDEYKDDNTAGTPAKEAQKPVITKTRQEKVIEDIIGTEDISFMVYISKDSNQLNLYQIDGKKARLMSTYKTTDGKSSDDEKTSEGDNKTPEGIYRISTFKEEKGSKRDALYGSGRMNLDYPNARDLQLGRTGGGILICGTDYDERVDCINSGSDCTNGGIVMKNDDITELMGKITEDISSTLVIIEHKDRQIDIKEYMVSIR